MGTIHKLFDEILQAGKDSLVEWTWRTETARLPTLQEIIRQGTDPRLALVFRVQNLVATFLESVCQLPNDPKKFRAILQNAEEKYMPGWPPMSPVTQSFFTLWAFHDLELDSPKFTGKETLGKLFELAADHFRLTAPEKHVLVHLNESRMHLCQNLGSAGGTVRLRELQTADEYNCLVSSGYMGAAGDLWLIRILPPSETGSKGPHLAVTSPYVVGTEPEDWVQFIRRQLARGRQGISPTTLEQLMKFGPNRTFWLDYILDGYLSHSSLAIFLQGIPDLPKTLPHGR